MENTGNHCVLCGNAALKIRFRGIRNSDRPYDVLMCPACGLAVTDPFPDEAETERLYSTENYRAGGKRFIAPMERLVRHFRAARLKAIEKRAPRGRLLDIGCGRGDFLSIAKAAGWQTAGIELNDETSEHARSSGLDIKTGALSSAGFESESFEVITIWHVLEHLPDPVGTIKECRGVLKPGGLLVVSVPNMDSIQARISGKHWFHLDVPNHLYHFSKRNLLNLLSSNAFKVIAVKHMSLEFGPFGFLQSLLNLAGIRHNLLYDMLKTGTLKKTLEGHLTHKALTLALLPFALAMSAVMAPLEALFGMGGSITVYAVKED